MSPDSLKAWRASLGLSQRAAAKALGCSRTSIMVWEKGSRRIPHYIALAAAALRRKLKAQP
jgi:DNA-binding XRE family transcriptional regulator